MPVPDLDGLLLLTTAGVGLVAVLVDLAAVGIRRPALAGLPMLAIYSVPVAVPLAADLIDEFCGRKERLWLDNQPAESAACRPKPSSASRSCR